MGYSTSPVDYWFMSGCGFALLAGLSLRFYVYRLSKVTRGMTETERTRAYTRLIVVATLMTGLATAIIFLTAHQGQLLKRLIGHAL